MNATIVTRPTATPQPATGKLNKQMDRLCDEDARRKAHQTRVIADNAEWCRLMGINPEDAVWMFL